VLLAAAGYLSLAGGCLSPAGCLSFRCKCILCWQLLLLAACAFTHSAFRCWQVLLLLLLLLAACVLLPRASHPAGGAHKDDKLLVVRVNLRHLHLLARLEGWTGREQEG
jgi:hypothetical protein